MHCSRNSYLSVNETGKDVLIATEGFLIRSVLFSVLKYVLLSIQVVSRTTNSSSSIIDLDGPDSRFSNLSSNTCTATSPIL